MQHAGVTARVAAAAPTGCFKCGRPGHWSRDCSSSSSAADPASNPSPNTSFPASKSAPHRTPGKTPASIAPAANPPAKRPPRTRPKVTPDLLLSDAGLGYILRHFPRSFKYHGRGHEVTDLGNLIGLYAEWHSHLIPYYSFDQFVRKVEQVGATKRVRRCIAELKERVARGGDPTKLHEPPTEHVSPDCEHDETIPKNPVADAEEPPLECHDADAVQEDMLDEIYQKTTQNELINSVSQEPHQASESITSTEVNPEHSSPREPRIQDTSNGAVKANKIQITEEQRARMDANRLKALERAAARARSSPVS